MIKGEVSFRPKIALEMSHWLNIAAIALPDLTVLSVPCKTERKPMWLLFS